MEQVLNLNKHGSILGLRELARVLNPQISYAIENQQNLVIDFSGVDSVSSSFADEFIAKLFVKFGAETFLKFIKIKNANEFVKTIINSSINERLNESR